jgi:hypothetical protein
MDQLTQFTFNLIVVFIPGLIIYFIFENYTSHKEDTKGYNVIIVSLLAGFFCYTVYLFILFIISLFAKVPIDHKIINCLFHGGPAPVKDIFLASILAVVLGVILIRLEDKRYIYNLLTWFTGSIKINNNIWQYAMSKAGWVRIRDIEKDRLYEGWIMGWSEITEKTEVLLVDVKIYKNSTFELLDEPQSLVLRNETAEFVVEFIEWPRKILKKGDNSDDRKNT